jgi:hypothetical protein
MNSITQEGSRDCRSEEVQALTKPIRTGVREEKGRFEKQRRPQVYFFYTPYHMN